MFAQKISILCLLHIFNSLIMIFLKIPFVNNYLIKYSPYNLHIYYQLF